MTKEALKEANNLTTRLHEAKYEYEIIQNMRIEIEKEDGICSMMLNGKDPWIHPTKAEMLSMLDDMDERYRTEIEKMEKRFEEL